VISFILFTFVLVKIKTIIMNNQKIISEIKYDIETGVYSDFPKLKDRLQYIVEKLVNQIYIENARKLSSGEIKTLEENEYLEKQQRNYKYNNSSYDCAEFY